MLQELSVTAVLESRLDEYKDSLREAENEVKRLTEENALLKELLQEEREIGEKRKQELDMERSKSAFFAQSDIGRRRKMTMERQTAKSTVDNMKKSIVYERKLVMDRGMSVYDSVKERQRQLRKPGRVSEDKVKFIKWQDSEREEDEDEDDDWDD